MSHSSKSSRNKSSAAQTDRLKDQPYYHGFLSREDLKALLPKKGDFLVRTSQVDPTKKQWENVLSVNTGGDKQDPVSLFYFPDSSLNLSLFSCDTSCSAATPKANTHSATVVHSTARSN